MIFDNDVVPDNEWQLLRHGFSEAGIPLSSRPSAILFRLRKRSEATGFDPYYSQHLNCRPLEVLSPICVTSYVVS